jgi:hypothetical protein
MNYKDYWRESKTFIIYGLIAGIFGIILAVFS